MISPRGGWSEALRELLERAAHDLLEALRELAADGGRPSRQLRREHAERRREPPGRLERDDGARPRAQLAGERTEVTRPPREVPDELVAISADSAHYQRGFNGRGAGKHRYLDALRRRRRDQPSAGIVDAGKARVRNERNALPGPQALEGAGRTCRLVVPVVARESRRDPVPLEQNARVARVLAEDEIRRTQLLEHAQRDIGQIADRRGAHGERHQPSRSSASTPPRSAETRPVTTEGLTAGLP